MKHSRLKIAATLSTAAALTLAMGLPAQAAGNGPMPAVVAQPVAEPVPAGEVSPFYQAPATLPADNGDLVRSEPSAFYLDPLKVLRAPAAVQRILYRSTDTQGKPVAVSGTVLVPNKAWTGAGKRPLVTYAVGTQGLGDQCAPSRQLAAGEEYEGLFIGGLLERGYAVAVTDYEGLGTEGEHTYMARASQGHAVLDAARAAQQLGMDGLSADGPVAIAGYSQGGGASASAAELAPTYAPELNLRGAYAGAIPSDLNSVGKNLDGSFYTGFLLYALSGLATTYDIDLAPYLNTAGEQKVAQTRQECTVTSVANNTFLQTASLTESGAKLSVLVSQAPFKAILAEQLIGNGRSPQVPVLVSQSLLDDVVPYAQARDVAERWCDQGSTVAFESTAGPTHIGGYAAAIPRAFLFLEARFAGVRPVSSCYRL